MYRDGGRNIVIIHLNDLLNTAIAQGMETALATYPSVNKPTVTLLPVDFNTSSFNTILDDLLTRSPDAIALLATTGITARLLQAWPTSLQDSQLYFGPGLLNDVLLANVPPGVLNGAFGVSPTVADKVEAAALDTLYQQTYNDLPFAKSYYYYDAAALLILAIEAAAHVSNGQPTRQQVLAQLREVASSPGERIKWNEIGRGLELLRQGKEVDYQGISGSLTLGDDGTIDRTSSDYRLEEVNGQNITFKRWIICL